MTCYVNGCWGFAKKCWRAPYKNAADGIVFHACADHWPKVVK